jgi:hypothetical protein
MQTKTPRQIFALSKPDNTTLQKAFDYKECDRDNAGEQSLTLKAYVLRIQHFQRNRFATTWNAIFIGHSGNNPIFIP